MKSVARSVDAPTCVPATRLRRLVQAILEAAGTPKENAEVVADSLVQSNLKGVDSHGFLRVAQYVGEIESGLTDPTALPDVERKGVFVRIRGNSGFGHLAGRLAACEALAMAHEHGVSVVAIAGVRHLGRIGEFVETLAEGGCVALAFCNCGPPHGRVAPTGGRESRFGTNPMAYGIPAGRHPAVIADFSTAAIAEGRVRLARDSGTQLPTGVVVDAEGRPTTDPGALYAGGAIVPFGGHKGYALSLLCELLGGVVADAGSAAAGDDLGNGMLLIALDPHFIVAHGFSEKVDRVLDSVLSTPPVPDGEVMLPGGPELGTEAERRSNGIPISSAGWTQLIEIAERLGVALDEGT